MGSIFFVVEITGSYHAELKLILLFIIVIEKKRGGYINLLLSNLTSKTVGAAPN